MTPRFLYRIVANRYPSFRLIASRLFRQTITPIPVQSMADLNDAPDLQTITASGVTGTDLFYVWDASASVAKTITFTEQRKLTLEVVESAPTMEGVVASVTLDPTGSNNSVKISAPGAGTAGNLLTGAIVIDSVSDRTQLNIAQSEYALVITSGDKRRMVVTGISSPTLNGSYTYAEEAGGKPSYSKDGSPTQTIAWSAEISKWTIANLLDIANRFESTDAVDSPELVNTWTATGTASGTPSLATAAATAAQVITFGNDNRDESYENGAGSNGSGTIAAVTTTSFTGGAGPTTANAPFLVNGSTLYVNVGTIAEPQWRKTDLDNLS